MATSYDCGHDGRVFVRPSGVGTLVEIPGVTWSVELTSETTDMTNFKSRGREEVGCGVIRINWSIEAKPETAFQLEAAATGIIINKLIDLELVKSATQKYVGTGRVTSINLANDANGAPTISISGKGMGPTWSGPGLPALEEEEEEGGGT